MTSPSAHGPPEYDTAPWIRFCLTAHYQQALTVVRRHEEYNALFERIDSLIKREGINQRSTLPLFDAALGMRVNNSRYQREAEVSMSVATKDLRLLVECGLFEPKGKSVEDTT